METALIAEVKDAVRNDPDWLEKFNTRQLTCLMKINQDILAEDVEVIDKQGFKVTKRIIPRKFYNRYRLYTKLKAAKRCKRDEHGEKLIKKLKE